MRTVTTIKSAAVMLLAGLWLSQSAWASLGLGEARVQSFLGQELEVDIALVRSEETSVESLQVAVADVGDYGRLGVPADALSLGLGVTLDQSVDPPVIRLRSDRVVEEPFVQVLIDARWASGRILREYTLFFDPPAVPVAPPIRRPQEPEPVTAAPPVPIEVQTPVDAEVSQEPQPDDTSATDMEADRVRQDDDLSAPEAPESAGPDSLVAESGDTLWSIASDWRPGGLTMHQAMLSIFDRNPDAFMGDNINRLRRGARLVLPPAGDLRAMPPEEATRRFREQVRAWEASRSAPAVPPAPEPVPEPAIETEPAIEAEAIEPQGDVASEEAAPSTSENEMTPPAEDSAADEVVVESGADQVAADPLAQPRLELTPPDEDLMAETAAIGAERDRLSAQLSELQSQIAQEGLENAEMDALVDQARQAIESADAGGMMVASEDLARLEAQLREAREARAAEQEAAEAAAAEIQVEPQEQSSDVVRETPAASFLERWMWPLVAVGGGLLLLMTLIGIRRSRSASADEQAASEKDRPAADSQHVVSDQDELNDSLGPVAGSDPADAEDDETERDAEAALMGILDRPEDDEDAPASTPETETEANQTRFEDASGPDEDEDQDLARLSNRLEQDDENTPKPGTDGPETVALEDEDYEALFASDDDDSQGADALEEEPAHLTLDFDLPEDEQNEETDQDSVNSGASASPFEIDEGQSDGMGDQEQPDQPGGENEWFALDDSDQPDEGAPGLVEESLGDPDDESAELEGAAAEETAALSDEDAEVKLDLARAYISMEDPGSARVLLEEVVNDGSPSHREEAQKLMDSLR